MYEFVGQGAAPTGLEFKWPGVLLVWWLPYLVGHCPRCFTCAPLGSRVQLVQVHSTRLLRKVCSKVVRQKLGSGFHAAVLTANTQGLASGQRVHRLSYTLVYTFLDWLCCMQASTHSSCPHHQTIQRGCAPLFGCSNRAQGRCLPTMDTQQYGLSAVQ